MTVIEQLDLMHARLIVAIDALGNIASGIPASPAQFAAEMLVTLAAMNKHPESVKAGPLGEHPARKCIASGCETVVFGGEDCCERHNGSTFEQRAGEVRVSMSGEPEAVTAIPFPSPEPLRITTIPGVAKRIHCRVCKGSGGWDGGIACECRR